MSFVGGRQHTRVEMERVCDRGGLGGGEERKKEGGWLFMKTIFKKDTYQEVSQSTGTSRDTHTHTHTPRLGGVIPSVLFLLGVSSQSPGRSRVRSSATVTPHCYSSFCEATPLYFLCLLQLCAFLQPLCFLIVEVAVSWMERAGHIYYPRQMCCWKWLLLLCLTSPTSLRLLLSSVPSPFSLHPFFLFIPLGHLSSTYFFFFQSISSPFLFFFPSSGWETCPSCRGTASLSRVALSRPSPKHTTTSYPGNCLSFWPPYCSLEEMAAFFLWPVFSSDSTKGHFDF